MHLYASGITIKFIGGGMIPIFKLPGLKFA